ncbi:netrin-G1-like [Hemiscyllium ocellatum]|uniref:netrin-G1-like n=1 Tax=Hemiscyllium ocellatum TaxID=170820 RepID=UPI002966A6A4|nr:netrin-G1-like [Hemiscyllium ocellatum]
MSLLSLLTVQTLWLSLGLSGQRFPSWGHYDLCKTQVHGDQGLSWDYMACQPEVTQLTKFLKISLDPPNSTCGESPEMYCTLENPYMCNNECDARTLELSHPPELMLDDEGRVPNTFWQSVSWRQFPEPLVVNLTLSWGKSIELTEDIVITFESGRPEQMVLEKSLDHGHTWQPYQFYAVDCLNSFGMESRKARDLTPASVLDIICTEEYSRGYVWKLEKTVRFEIQARFALFGGPRLSDMASLYSRLDTTKELRDFFTVTDLRLRLLRPATGPTSVDPLNLSKYFYAISNLDIRGRCKCHLHANNCIQENGRLSCQCEHNTTGQDCGSCKNGFHGRPWTAGSYLPIPKGTANVSTLSVFSSQVCQCFGHSMRCSYLLLFRAAVCVSCRHRTRGRHCHLCRGGYHRNPSAQLHHHNVCLDCQCNPDGSLHRRCNDTGYCDCKAGVTGPKCDKCLPGYYWHRGCRARVCDNVLTRCENGGVCEDNGRCLCLPPYTGLLCEKHQCKKGTGACVSQSPQDPSFTHLLLSLPALLITANDHGAL